MYPSLNQSGSTIHDYEPSVTSKDIKQKENVKMQL